MWKKTGRKVLEYLDCLTLKGLTMPHSAIPFRSVADAMTAGREFAASFADGTWKTDVQCSAHRLLTVADFASTFLPEGPPLMGTKPDEPCVMPTDERFVKCCEDLGTMKADPAVGAVDWKAFLAKALALLQVLLPIITK